MTLAATRNVPPMGTKRLSSPRRPGVSRLMAGMLMAILLGLDPAGESSAMPGPGDVRETSPSQILAHDLSVEVDPQAHHLHAVDRTTLRRQRVDADLVFSLNPALHLEGVQAVTSNGLQPVPVQRSTGEDAAQIVVAASALPAGDGSVVLEWTYDGMINEPPREPRHLRFVTPSETAGHIGEEGVYLSSETQWYPDQAGSLATFRLHVTTPEGWESVSHGREVSRARASERGRAATVAVWDVPGATEALTLVANRFVKTERTWNGIQVAAYLFPDDAGLGDEYVSAAIRYLEVYTKLLGSYPFPKFAVVENFFASGLGMPSFTLLGSGVIKRHYVQPYALGHEIVHSWFGNSVFNDTDQGNWVEGMTTYLANYYYDELKGDSEQAREHRRMMLLAYAVYVYPEDDYPLGRFSRKHDQKDNAIGYQKSAMVFHMLRTEVGDAAFWEGVRALVAERTGAYAKWEDLERIFGKVAKRDLRWFFSQWLDRAGSPSLEIVGVKASRKPETQGREDFALDLRIRQQGSPYRLRVPVEVVLEAGGVERRTVEIRALEEELSISLPSKPTRVRLDPDYTIFRRYHRGQVPPMLNLFVTDRSRSVVVPHDGNPQDLVPYTELAARVVAQGEGGEGASPVMTIQAAAEGWSAEDGPGRGSLLVLGGPGLNGAAQWAVRGCGDQVTIAPDRFTVQGHVYEGSDKALLVSCRPGAGQDRVVTLFYGLSRDVTAKIARLLFFYGWQSYLVFQDGKVIARGDFNADQMGLEVQGDAAHETR